MEFSQKYKKEILKYIWNHKNLTSQGNLEKEEQTYGDVTLSDFKLHCKAIVIRTV